MRVGGLKVIKRQLKEHRGEVKKRIEAGLIKVGLFIQRESQLRCPVDTGNMRAGANTRPDRSGGKFRVLVVYLASYAIFVHENLYARHTVGMAKFLTRAVTENLKRITSIFKDAFK